MNESEWWPLLIQGSKQAFSEIFLAYHDDLFRYGTRLIRDQETVNDCIQNLFLKIWKNRENLCLVKDIKPYLLRSLRNHIIDILELRRKDLAIDHDIEEYFTVEFTYEDFLTDDQPEKEREEEVIRLLNQLTPHQRHAIYLRYFEDQEFENIAMIMNMNVQSVRNLISRGMLAMRELMAV